MFKHPIGPSALLALLAVSASAGEIRGRVLVAGKPETGLTVSALPAGGARGGR